MQVRNLKSAYAPVAQLDRVSDSDSEGRWFESSRAYQKRAPHRGALFWLVRRTFDEPATFRCEARQIPPEAASAQGAVSRSLVRIQSGVPKKKPLLSTKTREVFLMFIPSSAAETVVGALF